jgi:HD-GYP domain-containing protein (c-di-GMP phosphodiesterase class II)
MTKILIIEDKKQVAEEISEILQNLGYVVSIVPHTDSDSYDEITMKEPVTTEKDKEARSAYATKSCDGCKADHIENAILRHDTPEERLCCTDNLHTMFRVNHVVTQEVNRDKLLTEVCNRLRCNHSYSYVWCAIYDGVKKPVAFAEAGVGHNYVRLMSSIMQGDIPKCGRESLLRPGVFVIKDVTMTCNTCPLADAGSEMSALSTRLESAGRVYGWLTAAVPSCYALDEDELALFSGIADDVALALHNIEMMEKQEKANNELKVSIEKSQRILQQTIGALSYILEKRDPYTAGHSQRVAQLVQAIADYLELPEEDVKGCYLAAIIHDIGKICVPTEILASPNHLNDVEFSLVKAHCQIGFDALKNIEFPWPIAKVVYQHHERINGTGYPLGLAENEITPGAKILAVADVVEAMCSHRPYRPAPGLKKALLEISKNRGILYDQAAVDACLALFNRRAFKFKERKNYSTITT